MTRHCQLEAAEVAGVAMEESERLVRRLEDIAADVEHREALAVGENSHGAARYQRGRQNVIIRTDSHDHARRARILAKTFAHL